MHRLVIVEDQTAIREMLAEQLALDSTYTLVGQCGDGQAALQLCLDLKPELLVLDVKLPGLNGVELLRRLAKSLPSMKVLVFSGQENAVIVRQMLDAGAHGFVEKTASFSEFKKGLATIAQGGRYLGPAIAELVSAVVDNADSGVSPDFLTSREREVMQLVAEGHSTKGIAEKLGISAKTVDNHRTNLMRKLDIHDVASLTRHALGQGLVSDAGNG
jgi:DNA-binding NarL/FixJ family response regulator